jgi:hypothetical protein
MKVVVFTVFGVLWALQLILLPLLVVFPPLELRIVRFLASIEHLGHLPVQKGYFLLPGLILWHLPMFKFILSSMVELAYTILLTNLSGRGAERHPWLLVWAWSAVLSEFEELFTMHVTYTYNPITMLLNELRYVLSFVLDDVEPAPSYLETDKWNILDMLALVLAAIGLTWRFSDPDDDFNICMGYAVTLMWMKQLRILEVCGTPRVRSTLDSTY